MGERIAGPSDCSRCVIDCKLVFLKSALLMASAIIAANLVVRPAISQDSGGGPQGMNSPASSETPPATSSKKDGTAKHQAAHRLKNADAKNLPPRQPDANPPFPAPGIVIVPTFGGIGIGFRH